MATSPEDQARILNLETQFALFLAGTIAVSNTNATQRKIIENALFPVISGLRTIKISGGDYSAHQVGDIIDHIDEATKTKYYGKIIALPFTGLADINDSSKFDRYEKDKPSL